MTKPKNFIFSSEYLSLAQSRKDYIEFNVDAKSTTAGSIYFENRTAHIPPEAGAIDRFYLSLDNNNWAVSSHIKKIFENDQDLSVWILVNRKSKDTIKFSIEYRNQTANAYTFPAFTLYVKTDSFKPPNIF